MTKLLAVLVEEKKSLNFNIYMTVKLSRNPRDSCYNITYGGRRAEIWRRRKTEYVGKNGKTRVSRQAKKREREKGKVKRAAFHGRST